MWSHPSVHRITTSECTSVTDVTAWPGEELSMPCARACRKHGGATLVRSVRGFAPLRSCRLVHCCCTKRSVHGFRVLSDHKSRNDLQHCYCIGMRRPPHFDCRFRTTGKSTAPGSCSFVFGRLQPWVAHDLVAVLHYLSGTYALHLHHVQHQRHRRHLSLNKRW